MKFFLLLPIVFVFACNRTMKQEQTVPAPHSLEIRYAKNFSIRQKSGRYTLEILNPETGKIERSIRLSEKIDRMIALSSTHIGMLDKLAKTDCVVGVSSMNYISNESVKQRFQEGKVIELGEESSIPLEQIVASKADVILYSGFSKDFPHRTQLEQLGILCIPNYDWREIHPLGKAEWIKVFGILLGKESEANAYFDRIEQEYLTLVKKAEKLEKSECLMSGNIIGDVWYTPAGESYNAHLFRDARISYPYAETEGTGSTSLTLERVLKDNVNCAFWINPGATSLDELESMNPKAGFFSSFKEKKVYCYSAKGNAFWERSAAEPHHVLSDLIQITHPDAGLSDKLYFYSRLE